MVEGLDLPTDFLSSFVTAWYTHLLKAIRTCFNIYLGLIVLLARSDSGLVVLHVVFFLRSAFATAALFQAELIIHALINVKHILPLPPSIFGAEPGQVVGRKGGREGPEGSSKSREGGQKEVAAPRLQETLAVGQGLRGRSHETSAQK